MDNILYSWKFDDSRERSSLWYIIALSIVLWVSIWWFFTKQYWLSFIVLLIAGLAYYLENNSEDQIEVVIQENGILIAQSFYDFSSISSFTPIYVWEEVVSVRFNLNKKWLRFIDVQVDNKILQDLKSILWEFMAEDEKIEMAFSEKMTKKLKL